MTEISSSSPSDIAELSNIAPFQWGNLPLVGRETEIQTLQEAWRRTGQRGANGEACILRGRSGTGKSSLLDAAFNHQLLHNALWASGKYDQNEENQLPFAAIVDATSELVHGINSSGLAKEIKKRIKAELQEDELVVLAEKFPTIRLLIPSIPDSADTRGRASMQVNESLVIRSLSIYRRFLSAVASPESPLLFFLDDLQWADSTSKKLINSILTDNSLSSILFIGAVRDGEKTNFQVPSETSFRVQEITLSGLTHDAINAFVAKATEQDPSATADLGKVVFSRTNGNPYFARQFLETLFNRDLLTWHATTKTYSWDVDDITKCMKPSLGLADILVDRIKVLDRNTQLVLVIAASLGHSFTQDVLEPIMASIDLISLFPADLAVDHGDVEGQGRSTESASGSMMGMSRKLISKCLSKASRSHLVELASDQKVYKFAHDRVQQAASSLLPRGERGNQIKSTLGSLMLELSESNPDEPWMLFAATNLLEKYGKGTISTHQLAKLCSQATTESIKQAAFEPASKYAESGIIALGDEGWQGDSYPLCLELHNLSVESHFADGNFKRAKKRIRAIRQHAQSLKDRFRAFNVLLSMLFAEQNGLGCLSESLEGLNALGVSAPKRANTFTVVSTIMQTKRLLKGRKAQDLENLPDMQDEVMKQACHIYGMMGKAAWLVGDSNRFLLCCLSAFQLVLKYGLNINAPATAVSYGIVLAHLGNLNEAYEFGVTASKLANRPELAAGMGACETAAFVFLLHLKDPLTTSFSNFPKVIRTCFEYGDAYNGCQALGCHVLFQPFIGATLFQQEKEMKRTIRLLKEYKNRTIYNLVLPFAQYIENLRGKSQDASTLTGTYMDQSKCEALFHRNGADADHVKQMQNINVMRSILLYLNRDHLEAERLRKRYSALPAEDGTTLTNYFRSTFLALNCYELVRKTTQKTKGVTTMFPDIIQRRRLLGRANQYVSEVAAMGKSGSPTSAALLKLLEAERLMCTGKARKAVDRYSDAVRLLGEGQLFLLEAIACERLGMCLRDINNPQLSEVALQEAWQKFRAHGAVAKLERMKQDYPDVMMM